MYSDDQNLMEVNLPTASIWKVIILYESATAKRFYKIVIFNITNISSWNTAFDQ